MSTSRVEAFSDSVFAFAATLLVVGLHDPGTRGDLAGGLINQWPSYAAYVVSFTTIGIIWINHNNLFGHLSRLDRQLIFWNILLLMVVALIPSRRDCWPPTFWREARTRRLPPACMAQR